MKERTQISALLLLALTVFSAACFGLLRVLTDLPVGVCLLFAIPSALATFVIFVKTHERNGFDGE